ncbi:MAG: hypothetical protein GKR87_06825 [Kiritimatiellae bacterium]|nr:hypothetical protein [Kiritimatiellia bacterium]
MAIQSVMHAPINVRTWVGVPKRRNPKGTGLFAHAYMDLASFLEKEDFGPLQWLIENASPSAGPSQELLNAFGVESSSQRKRELEGLGWGYHYDWQDVGFLQKKHAPNRVVSCWIGFAFMRAYDVTQQVKYLQAAEEIVTFLLNNPKRLEDTPEMLCLSYVPIKKIDWAVMDVSALVAAMCARVGSCLKGRGRVELFSQAKRLIHFVTDKQTDYGAWFYTWPAGDSHIKHDNYHTGIILDCLVDYMVYSGDHQYAARYELGLEYYRDNLFLDTGAPKWMNDNRFPHDIHGAASGILAFSRAATYFENEAVSPQTSKVDKYLTFANRIFKWTIENLYSSKGYFYYQKNRFFTKRFCLMRWGNAWMSRAMTQLINLEFLLAKKSKEKI